MENRTSVQFNRRDALIISWKYNHVGPGDWIYERLLRMDQCWKGVQGHDGQQSPEARLLERPNRQGLQSFGMNMGVFFFHSW